MWMAGMALYTKVLRDIPEKVDKIKNRFSSSKARNEDNER